jgi:hypothetical protein
MLYALDIDVGCNYCDRRRLKIGPVVRLLDTISATSQVVRSLIEQSHLSTDKWFFLNSNDIHNYRESGSLKQEIPEFNEYLKVLFDLAAIIFTKCEMVNHAYKQLSDSLTDLDAVMKLAAYINSVGDREEGFRKSYLVRVAVFLDDMNHMIADIVQTCRV